MLKLDMEEEEEEEEEEDGLYELTKCVKKPPQQVLDNSCSLQTKHRAVFTRRCS